MIPLVVVGHCRETPNDLWSARLLVITQGATEVRCRYSVGGTASSVTSAPEAADPYERTLLTLDGLPGGSMVDYIVEAGAHTYSDQFRVPAKDGRAPRLALVSCNGWFSLPESERWVMWRRLRERVEDGHVDLIVHAGDQIYADKLRVDAAYEATFDSAPLTEASLTRRYRQLYVSTWSRPETRKVLGSCPSVMTWDDHDIYDGWGSHDVPEERAPLEKMWFAAAARAYQEFQLSHGPDGTDGFRGFVIGKIAIGLLDTRTHRDWSSGTILGRPQLQALTSWLESLCSDVRVFIVAPVPVVHANVAAALALLEHAPGTPETLDDLRDSWVATNNRGELQTLLLRLFKAGQKRQVTLLSGDVHVATLGEVRSTLQAHASAPRIHQIVASGIGHPPPTGVAGWLMKLAVRGSIELVGEDFVGRLRELDGRGTRVLDTRNFAIIDPNDSRGELDPDRNLTVTFECERQPSRRTYRLLG